VFLEVVQIIQDLDGPRTIHNSELITKDTLTTELEKLKESMEKQFDDIIDFTMEEIRNG